MIKKANIQWSAKQLTKSIEKGTINFDNAVQRGYCWNTERKSLLIHSMIEGYPIPAFYASKDENGYSMLDGKQRSNAINDYINNKYVLKDIPEIITDAGETIDINGKTFSELSEEIQDVIKDYSLTVYYFDGISDEEINEMFFRLNNGKPLTSIELTRVKAKSIDKIKEIGKHELFNSTLTEKSINKYTHEDIVIKAWALLNEESPSFETKEIRKWIETADITDEQAEQLNIVFTRILEVYTDIKAVEDKEAQKVAKRVITRTHLLSLVPIALQSITDGKTVEEISEFVMSFFNGKKSATNNETYNTASGSHSASADNVKKRITAITEAYKAFYKVPEIKNNVTPINRKVVKDTLLEMSDDWEENIPNNVISAYKNTI